MLGVICADQLCWNTGKQISLVDKTQEDARQKLKNITVLAYDSLHPELKERFVVSRANSGEFGVRFFEYEEAQTSTMFAGTHARGGSNFFVWISEWGVIQAEDLRRSEEILTGAIPSAKDGLVVVETTWRGGRGGHLWDIVKKALETPEEQKHADDWRVVFFPWQDDPTYCDAEPQRLKEETVRYFSDKPGFSNGQKSRRLTGAGRSANVPVSRRAFIVCATRQFRCSKMLAFLTRSFRRWSVTSQQP